MPELSRNTELERKVDRLGKPLILVFNKIDVVSPEALKELKSNYPGAFFVSGTKNLGIGDLRRHIQILGKKMKHPGTFNGNPLSAAAGCAALDALADGIAGGRAIEAASQVRGRLNELFARKSVSWIAYGEFSMIHILPNYSGPASTGDQFIPCEGDYRRLDTEQPPSLKHAFRAALLTQGVDWFGWSGMTSAVHSDQDITETVDAFERTIDSLASVIRV